MKKKILSGVLGILVLFCLPGCAKEIPREELFEIGNHESSQNENKDIPQAAQFEVADYVLQLNENAYLNAFCYGEEYIYYAETYGDYYEGLGNAGIEVDFSPEHNTAIYAYNTKNKETSLLYKYKTDHCVSVTDMQFSDYCLYWEDYEGTGTCSWRLYCLNLDDGGIAEVVFTAEDIQSDQPTITPVVHNGVIYWYDSQNDSGKRGLYTYHEGELQQIKEVIEGSPYEHIGVLEEVIPVVEKNDDECTVQMYDCKKLILKESFTLKKEPYRLIANSQYAAWRDKESSYTIHVRNLQDGTEKDVSYNYFFSYRLVGNQLVVNADKGVVAHDLVHDTTQILLESDTGSHALYYMLQNPDGTIYAEASGKKNTIVVIKKL